MSRLKIATIAFALTGGAFAMSWFGSGEVSWDDYNAAVRKGLVANVVGLKAWLVVFAVVALQTVTLVRPMLAPIGTPRTPEGKCFFLMHFGKAVGFYSR